MAIDFDLIENDTKKRKPRTVKGRKISPWENVVTDKQTDNKLQTNSDKVTTKVTSKVTTENPSKNQFLSKEKGDKVTTKVTSKVATNTTPQHKSNDKVTTKFKSDVKSSDKVTSQPTTEVATKVTTKVTTKADLAHRPGKDFSELSELSQTILNILYESCLETLSQTTSKINISYLSEATLSSKKTIKRTIQRLSSIGIIQKDSFKDGRGGWTKYKINQYTYHQIRQKSDVKSSDKSDVKSGDKVTSQLATNLPSSSISFNNINKELTTNEYPFNPADVPGQQQLGPQFDSDWQNIDISPLQTIGFTNHHLSQIFTKNELKPKQVQDSINAFAFDLNENQRGEKIKTSPLNLFMGILKGGNPYNPPKNYESDEDRILREQVEAEREKLEKRQQLQSELRELKYQNWLLDLTIEKKLEILDVPLKFFEKMPLEAIQEGLKKHFEMKVL